MTQLFSSFAPVYGQDPFLEIHHVSDLEGAPRTSYIKQVYQDVDGFIWCLSVANVFRYDGYKTDEISIEASIQNQVLIDFCQDQDGAFWLRTSELYRLNKTENSWQQNNTFKTDSTETIVAIAANSNSALWLASNSAILAPSREGYIRYPLAGVLDIDLNSNGSAGIVSTQENVFEFKDGEIRKSLSIKSLWDHQDVKMGQAKYITDRQILINIFSTKYDRYYHFDLESGQRELLCEFEKLDRHYISSHHITKNGHLFISNSSRILHFDKSRRLLNEWEVRLDLSDGVHFEINDMHEGREGRLWIGSNRGLFHAMLSDKMKKIDHAAGLKNDRVRSLYVDEDDAVFVGTYYGEVYKVSNLSDNKGEVQIQALELEGNHEYLVNSIFPIDKTNLGLQTNKDVIIYNKEKDEIIRRYEGHGYGWDGFKSTDGDLLVSSQGRLIDLLNQDTVFIMDKPNGLIYTTFEDIDKSIWLGTNYGLFRIQRNYRPNTSQIVKEYHPLTATPEKDPCHFWSILPDREAGIWIGSSNCGLWHWDRGSNQLDHFPLALDQNRISGMFYADEDGIWLAVHGGICYYDIHQNKITECVTRTDNQMLSSMYNAQAKLSNGDIIAGTSTGLLLFSNDAINDTIVPEVKFSRVKVNGKADYFYLKTHDHLKLKNDENFLVFQFGYLNYTRNASLSFEYRLIGIDKDWTSIQSYESLEAIYARVPYGKYKFQVRGVRQGNQLGEILELSLTIAPKLYQRVSFKVLVVLLVLIVISYLIWVKILTITNEKHLAESRLVTLRSQMNPHFIFNALTSIQNMILQNKNESAMKSLSRFSRLIRMSLEHSDERFIRLEEDLNLLRSYIEIESDRFDIGIDYSITLLPSEEISNRMIPPMLIQPYVENAITHGLAEQDHKKLEIVIEEQKATISVSIIDNGIGREVSLSQRHPFQTGKQKSMGENISLNRIKNINKLYDIKCSVQSSQILDANDNIQGTKVEIIIGKND